MSSQHSVLPPKIDSLYLLKAICALFVVFIHSSMWGKECINPIIRIAVPCFYATSGFFLYTGNDITEIAKSLRWIKKISVTYLFLTLFYGVFLYLLKEQTYTWKDIGIALFTGTTPIFHLWYLVSLIQALACFFVLKRFRFWGILSLIFIFILHFVFQICLAHKIVFRHYLVLWQPLWALFMLGVGYFVSKYSTQKVRGNRLLFLILTFLGAIFIKYICPVFGNDAAIFIKLVCDAIIPATLLTICVSHPNFSFSAASWVGKFHSANIYYYHVFVYLLLDRFCGNEIGSRHPLLTFLLTLLMSVIIFYIQKIYRMKKA